MIVSRWATRQANQDPNSTPEELTETANRILHRQFISRADPGGAAHFDRVSANLDYFKDLFGCFGFGFIFNDTWGYTGYVSPSAFNNARVPTTETIVLLCLRLLYGEGAEKGYFVGSAAEILVEEEEIQSVFSSLGSRTLKPGELRGVLQTFKRQGLVGFDSSYSINVSVDVSIRPTIMDAVDESFLARLEAWAEPSKAERSPSTDAQPIADEGDGDEAEAS